MRVPRRFEGAENQADPLCSRHRNGGRPSIRVWYSQVGAPADGNEDRTHCQRRMTLSLNPAEKMDNIRSQGASVS
jgi:hypothetical protein